MVYRGDQTQRQIEVGPDTYVRDALPGSEIFMRIPTGDGFVDGGAAAGNTGNGVLTNITRDGSDSWNGQSFSIRFTAADQYEVLDGAGNVTGTGTFKAGDNVEVNGVRLQITGAPAAGDSFNVKPASSRDIFDTMDKLIAALDADTGTTAKMSAQQNELQSALRDVARVGADDRFARGRWRAAEGTGQRRRHARSQQRDAENHAVADARPGLRRCAEPVPVAEHRAAGGTDDLLADAVDVAVQQDRLTAPRLSRKAAMLASRLSFPWPVAAKHSRQRSADFP